MNTALRRSCLLPHSTDIDYKLLHTYTNMHSLPLPPSLASVRFEPASLTGRSVTGAETNGCWTGWLLAGAGFVFPCCKSRVFIVYVLFVLRCFFPVLTLYSLRSIVWGLFFLSPHFPHVNAVFSSIPCLPVLSTPLSYVCCVCIDRLMANFAGTCD